MLLCRRSAPRVPAALLVYILVCAAFFPAWSVDAAKNKTAKTTKQPKTKTSPQPKQNNTFVPCQKGELADSECQNGASCLVKVVNSLKKKLNSKSKSFGGVQYKCVCRLGFEGIKCEKAVCKKNVCKNKGKCLVIQSSGARTTHSCTCKPPYGGQYCDNVLQDGELDDVSANLMIRDQCKKGSDCIHGKCKKINYAINPDKALMELREAWVGTKYEKLLSVPLLRVPVDQFRPKYVCVCDYGYDGPYCSNKCLEKSYVYGQWCNRKCSQYCKKKKCDPKTGHCSPCERGWAGQDCSVKLRCKEGKTCVNGKCDAGRVTCDCNPGFYKTSCDTPCRKRKDVNYKTYGENCAFECGHCIKPQCDEKNGTCRLNKKGERCIEPYAGLLCKDVVAVNEVVVVGEVELNAESIEVANEAEGFFSEDDLDSLLDGAAENPDTQSSLEEDSDTDDDVDDDVDDSETSSDFGDEDADDDSEASSDFGDDDDYDDDFSSFYDDEDETMPLRARLLKSVRNWFRQAGTRIAQGASGILRRLNIRRRRDSDSSDGQRSEKRKRRQTPTPTLTMGFIMGYPPEAVQGVNIGEKLASALKAEKDSFNVPGLTVNVNSIRAEAVVQNVNNVEQNEFDVGLTTLQSIAGGLCILVLLTLAAGYMFKKNTRKAKTRQGVACKNLQSQGVGSRNSWMSHSSVQHPYYHQEVGHSPRLSQQKVLPTGFKKYNQSKSDL